MPKLRLGDADRERLGCPELLEVDLNTVTNREAIGLAKLGYPTPWALGRALASEERDYEAWTALVWLGLRRGGVDVDGTTLEFSVPQLTYVPDETPAPRAEPGKAPGPARSTTSARTRSTRGATSKARSTPTGSPS